LVAKKKRQCGARGSRGEKGTPISHRGKTGGKEKHNRATTALERKSKAGTANQKEKGDKKKNQGKKGKGGPLCYPPVGEYHGTKKENTKGGFMYVAKLKEMGKRRKGKRGKKGVEVPEKAKVRRRSAKENPQHGTGERTSFQKPGKRDPH